MLTPCVVLFIPVYLSLGGHDATKQEHLQGLKTQYRHRVEAMRGQVQQLTARHEISKKELAASETVSNGMINRGGFPLKAKALILPLLLFMTLCSMPPPPLPNVLVTEQYIA